MSKRKSESQSAFLDTVDTGRVPNRFTKGRHLSDAAELSSEPQVQIIHLGTQVATRFGVVTAEGDTVEFPPVQINVPQLNQAAFMELLKAMMEQREVARQKVVEAIKGNIPAEVKQEHGSDPVN